MNYLAEFQSFTTKFELNEAISSHMSRCKHKLNETDRDVLLMLSRYSVKYPGAAHLKLATIAQSLKKSTRTIRRSVEKLEHLKVINRKSFMREKSGGRGANLFIFLPVNDRTDTSARQQATNPTPASPEENKMKNEPISSLSKELCLIKTSPKFEMTYYDQFKNCIESYIGKDNHKLVNDIYGMYRGCTLPLLKFSIHENKKGLFEALSLQALQITFQTTKNKKVHTKPGYYAQVLRNRIDEVVFENAFMDYDVPLQMKHIIVRPVDLTVFGLSQNRNYKEKKWSGKKKENDYY